MKLHVLEIPDAPSELVTWLEHQIVGMNLRSLVAELSVFAESPSSSPTLDQVLGESVSTVLTSGLAAANGQSIQSLLQSPELLYELQERVLVDGGPYWNKLITGENSSRDIEQSWQELQSRIEAESDTTLPGPWGDRPVPDDSRSSVLRGLMVLVAAALLIGVGTFLFKPPARPDAPGWGFNHPDAIQEDLSASEYLQQLASSAGQWRNKRPDSREKVKERISQFIAGCDTLIAADHQPLARADRDWLVERCRAWRDKLASHIADLDTGSPPLEVRTSADETIDRLIDALKKRANEAVSPS